MQPIPAFERLWRAFFFALSLLALVAGLFAERAAQAQSQFGQLQGTVKNQSTGRPFPGVTVQVTGAALQGDQTEVTDQSGHYLITQLPPGDGYVVRFYFNDVVVERPGIRLAQNKTLTINAAMPEKRSGTGADKIVIRERAPNVDTASANTGIEINQEIMQNTPVRGRTFESMISLAPGAADVAPRGVSGGDVGVSFSGSTGNESQVLIDGLSTTDLAFGMVSTQLHQNFIQEVNVISGGYQAEYGRATGAVIAIATKSGSNEFHGSVFGSVAPFQAQARAVARLGEAIATRTRIQSQYDYGFDLGGPLIKDRLWFYVGFAPTVTNTITDRTIRVQRPEADPDYQSPAYLSDPALVDGLRGLARRTEDVPGRSQQIQESRRIYNWIGKLQINLSQDHNIVLSYIGSPQFGSEYGSGSGYSTTGSSNPYSSDLFAQHINRSAQVHDATAHYTGKFLARKLQLDILYGFHFVRQEELPDAIDLQQIRYRAPSDNPYSLADFENVPECQKLKGQTFNPCPVTDYTRGGFGQYTPLRTMQRHSVQASLTYYLQALGSHALKLGLDFEDQLLDNTKKFTGTDFDPRDPFSGRISWDTDASGSGLRINRGYALKQPSNYYGQLGVPCAGQAGRYCFPDFRAETETRNWGLYLRDSWNVGPLPGLVINAGLRWELQELFATDHTRSIFLWDNIAPRIGAAYDFTKKGRSKLYVNYGRFYESIPMDLNDRIFSQEGFLRGRGFATDCPRVALQPGGQPVPVPQSAVGAPCSLDTPRLSGGSYGPVAPGLHGQFQDEVVVGGQYDVGLDIVLGAFYAYRHLGTIVEDLSVDGGSNYFIANPGVESDPATAQRLAQEATQAADLAAKNPGNDALQAAASLAQNRLNVYKAAALFPKPQRDYHGITVTANKRFSNRFAVLASYTYSRLLGNYPGLFSPYVNQLDPNISSQYDIIDLTANRNGPLNNDRPHNFKLTGYYAQPIVRAKGTLTLSLTFTAISGRPIQVLGAHIAYGGRQTLILPSGSGGRTPTVTQLDLHLGYDQMLGKLARLSVFVDIINALNLQQVTNIDDEYTFSIVNPILYGRPADLKRLRADDGSPLIVNSNYGQPTAFQAPLMMRLGGRLSF